MIVLALIMATGNCLAQIPEKFSHVFQEDAGPGHAIQGSAIYGDILFQFHNTNKTACLFSISQKKFILEIPMDEKATYHCNNAEFSTERYDSKDHFPLLYISMENVSEHKILVYRIMNEASGAKAEKIQEIILPRPVEMGLYYPNITLDKDERMLYITGYSLESWNKDENGNGLQLLQFALPDFRSGSIVSLSATDILSRKHSDFRVATQGATIRGGKLYQSFGVPGMGPTSLSCFNLKEGKTEWTIDLPLKGFKEEPEGLDMYGDEIYIIDGTGGVWATGIHANP